jgi:outer membrane protein TolC
MALAACAAAAQMPEHRVTLRDLIAEALKNDPEALAAQKRYEAARQRPTQESSLPDPMVSVGYASVGNPLPGAGLGSQPQANAGVMVSQEVPFPGKLKLKGDMAAVDAQAEFEQYQAVQLGVVSRVKQAYYRLQYSYAALDLLAHHRELFQALEQLAVDRYSGGLATQSDVFRAQTQISILETRVVKMEQERRAREAEINALLNRAVGTPVGQPEDLKAKESTVTLEEMLASARKNSPVLARGQKMVECSDLEVDLAKRAYDPDFTLNAGYYSMGSMGTMYELRADVKVPLYFWRKQSAGVAEQAMGLTAAHHDYEAADQSLRYQIQDAYESMQASAKLMKIYSETVAPQASLGLESSLLAYGEGRVDFLSVISDYIMSFDYAMSYYDESLNYMLALARMEEMTGRQLTDGI